MAKIEIDEEELRALMFIFHEVCDAFMAGSDLDGVYIQNILEETPLVNRRQVKGHEADKLGFSEGDLVTFLTDRGAALYRMDP